MITTVKELIEALSKYPKDAEIDITVGPMIEWASVQLGIGYDEESNTVELEIY